MKHRSRRVIADDPIICATLTYPTHVATIAWSIMSPLRPPIARSCCYSVSGGLIGSITDKAPINKA